MKLYTINATPVRDDIDQYANDARVDNYPKYVSILLSKYGIDGFTIYQVQGYWKGTPEASFKIEIATDLSLATIKDIAYTLRDQYNQDSVMVTDPSGEVRFL